MKNVLTIIFVLTSILSNGQTLEDYFKVAAENNPELLS